MEMWGVTLQLVAEPVSIFLFHQYNFGIMTMACGAFVSDYGPLFKPVGKFPLLHPNSEVLRHATAA